MKVADRRLIARSFARLLARWGRQNWWPADSPFEVAIGAVLVQNTAWRNADRALQALRHAGLLRPELLAAFPRARLQKVIRPAGFYVAKSRTLQSLARTAGSTHAFSRFLRSPGARERLLSLTGIGPETADAVLLYGARRENFVVDIYLRRHLAALGFEALSRAPYERLQSEIELVISENETYLLTALRTAHRNHPAHSPTAMGRTQRKPRVALFAELHAVLVREGVEKESPARAGLM